MQAALEHREVVRAIHVLAAEMAPHLFEFGHRQAIAARLRRQHDRVDGAGGRPADDRERIHRPLWQEFGQRLQHPDLKGTAGTAAG